MALLELALVAVGFERASCWCESIEIPEFAQVPASALCRERLGTTCSCLCVHAIRYVLLLEFNLDGDFDEWPMVWLLVGPRQTDSTKLASVKTDSDRYLHLSVCRVDLTSAFDNRDRHVNVAEV